MEIPPSFDCRYFTSSAGGVVRGPFTVAALRQLVDSGIIGNSDFVAQEGSETWMPVPEAISLLAEATPAAGSREGKAGEAARIRRPIWHHDWFKVAMWFVLILAAINFLSSLRDRPELPAISPLQQEIQLMWEQHQYGDAPPPMYCAARDNRIDLVTGMLDEGGSPEKQCEDYDREQPIHIAAKNGHLEMVRLLLKRGSDANASSKHGGRPLHRAAEGGHLEVAKLLLESGASLEHEDRNGFKPIHSAAFGGSPEMPELLAGAGASIKSRTGPAIRLAGQTSKYEFSEGQFLRSAGINPIDGKQPIHVASQRGQVEAVRYLLAHGAQADNTDNNSKSPRDYAKSDECPPDVSREILMLLETND